MSMMTTMTTTLTWTTMTWTTMTMMMTAAAVQAANRVQGPTLPAACVPHCRHPPPPRGRWSPRAVPRGRPTRLGCPPPPRQWAAQGLRRLPPSTPGRGAAPAPTACPPVPGRRRSSNSNNSSNSGSGSRWPVPPASPRARVKTPPSPAGQGGALAFPPCPPAGPCPAPALPRHAPPPRSHQTPRSRQCGRTCSQAGLQSSGPLVFRHPRSAPTRAGATSRPPPVSTSSPWVPGTPSVQPSRLTRKSPSRAPWLCRELRDEA